MSNNNLNRARKDKNDEFYTQQYDISNEISYYEPYFEDKVVLCNCDDPFESEFFKVFALRFHDLKLKKLIATYYVDSPIAGKQLNMFELLNNGGVADKPKKPVKKAHKIIITRENARDVNGDNAFDIEDVKLIIQKDKGVFTELEGDGDFRSPECRELMEEADVIVTNPPFSLFREFIAQCMEMDKKFLVIGNYNAVHYKEIFPLIMDNKVWLGVGKPKEFIVPSDFAGRNNVTVKDNGQTIAKFGNICWFTNLDNKRRSDVLDLCRTYEGNEGYYPKYDNYDAINVDKLKDIPMDYEGAMGVPITFLDKYNPDQFEIIGLSSTLAKPVMSKGKMCTGIVCINGEAKYERIFIKNKHPKKKKTYKDFMKYDFGF